MANMLQTSVRPIREFREMPITDITVRTHPITDTDIRYEGHSVAVGLLLMPSPSHLPDTPELAGRIGVWATRLYAWIKRPSVYAATVYGWKRRGGVGRHCPQALGQTVVIISKQASGAKQAGRGRGRCTQPSLWVWHIDKHCSGPQVTLHWARRLHMRRLRRPASVCVHLLPWLNI